MTQNNNSTSNPTTRLLQEYLTSEVGIRIVESLLQTARLAEK